MAKSKSGGKKGPRPVRRFVLKNGLTVLIAQNRSSPVAEILLHVNTGYLWEPDRYQGLSHVVEHNLMQASAKRPKRAHFSMARRSLGAFYDAGTGYDFTEYLMMLEPRFLKEAMEILCDGFFYPVFREDTFRAEMGAILQESRRKEDLPKPMALEKLYTAAFRVGRRRRWRLGTARSLGRLTPLDLKTYFRDRYGPGNIVLAVGGNIDADAVATAVRRIFGRVPAVPVRGKFEDPEPEQRGARYLEVRKPVGTVYWNAGFHAPPFLHPNWYAVQVLATVLGTGRGARLPRVIRDERGLADSVAAFPPDHDEYGLLTLEMETDVKRFPAAEESLIEELARVRRGGISSGELDRARAVIERDFLRSLGDIRHQLDWLALYEMRAGGFRNAAKHLERIFAVREGPLNEVARWVLRPGNLSVCAVLPEGDELPDRSSASLERTATQVEARLIAKGVPSAVAEERRRRVPAPVVLGAMKKPSAPKRKTLRGGGVLIVRPDRNLPLFYATILFRGGRSVEKPAQAGTTAVMLGAMLRGAAGKSAREVALAFENMGVGISTVLQPDAFGFSLEGPSASFDTAMALVGEVIVDPDFDAREVKRERESTRGRIRASGDNPRAWVLETFEEILFKGHAYGNPVHGLDKAVRGLKPPGLKRWHKRTATRANLFVAVGGDVTAKKAEEAAKALARSLPKGSAVKVKPWKGVKKGSQKCVRKPLRQTATAIGFPIVPLGHKDYEAFDVLAWMCRGDGGRFYDEIRAKRGLAYIVHAWNLGRSQGAGFVGFTATAPKAAKEAERILLEEYARFSTEPPGKEELARTKSLALGMHALPLRTGSAFLKALCVAEASGVPMERWLNYEKAVKKVTSKDIARIAKKYFDPKLRVKVQIMGKEG
ncbi:MAG: M16 family metallopeptidase [Planctomycetota bacterium]|jgi:zinc protease